MKKKILDSVSYMIIVVTLLLIVVFQNNGQVMLFIGAGGILLYGLVSCLQLNKYGTLFLGCGGSLLITMILYTTGYFDKLDSITFMITLSMMLISVISLIFMYFDDKNILKKYTLIVEGEVIDLEKNPNTKKDYYRPVYIYNVDDMGYEVVPPYYFSKNIPKIGDTLKIYVNPQEHGEVYFPKDLLTKIKLWGAGIGMFIISFVILITLFF